VAEVGPGSITARLADVLGCEFVAVRTAVQPFKTRRSTPSLLARQVCAAVGRPDRVDAATAVLDQATADTAVMTPYVDVRPALKALSAMGLGVVLLSNVMGAAAPPPGKAPPLDDAVDATFYSCDLGYAKPDSRAFDEVARRLDVKARHIVHIGDACDTDVRGAIAAGWQALLIDRGARSDGPSWVRSLRSLPDRLRADFGVETWGQRGALHAS
jgi:HAD superfamily hydrolase (TIGR01509 family)